MTFLPPPPGRSCSSRTCSAGRGLVSGVRAFPEGSVAPTMPCGQGSTCARATPDGLEGCVTDEAASSSRILPLSPSSWLGRRSARCVRPSAVRRRAQRVDARRPRRREEQPSREPGRRRPTAAAEVHAGARRPHVAQPVPVLPRRRRATATGPGRRCSRRADLGREEWQSKVNDEEIAATITNGKGRMPKFELPEEVVKGLVVRVRSFRGQ